MHAATVSHSAKVEPQYGESVSGEFSCQKDELAVRSHSILWSPRDDDDQRALRFPSVPSMEDSQEHVALAGKRDGYELVQAGCLSSARVVATINSGATVRS
jgi:hypothetical protein